MKADPRRHANRVVIDTHVWINGCLTRDGTPARLARHAIEHKHTVFSDATFTEIETRL